MRQRFNQRNDGDLDPVPWELDEKAAAYAHTLRAGYRVPRFFRAANATEALRAGESFGRRFVVKQPNLHSSKGIFALEHLGSGYYLDLISLRTVTAADVIGEGEAPDYWLAEEFVDSGIDGKPLPFDYKIYAFRGQVTHITQIDRNVSPPRVALFDGAFLPLVHERDFITDGLRWKTGHHVLPRHAGAMLEMAATLSAGLTTRFVKVDSFDGPDGPVLGEFTFASGADDTGMVRYSDRILALLDHAMAGETVPALSGFDVDMTKYRASLDRERTITADPTLYSRMSASASEGDRRYAPLLADGDLIGGAARPVFILAANLIGYLNGDRSRAFHIQQLLRRGTRTITGTARLQEFEEAAVEYHDSLAAGSPWHTARSAEVRLGGGDESALDVLRDLAVGGYPHAQQVVRRYEG
ncbi:ATP-grasp fold amidoligase family protein [Arthrobacter agilis]|uniref:ATP-grasp fold amidoligase family protein n=1 Tax=Arthrobacter agilis TaxID=37921 RepID=UPI002366EAE6|nr:ATP-grasp fold amidoligase family protein [Arthrobacter agilis]WDF32129.1 ATP-grasp fold amidoligase family protein [Arthrobacter agilis]